MIHITGFDQNKYVQRFVKEHYVRLQVLLHKEHDRDIIEKLNAQENKSRYIKTLIRKDSEEVNNEKVSK